MGKFRVVEHENDDFITYLVSKVYETYPEASKKWDELMSERPKKNFGIEAESDGEWYALA